jgi:glycerophosphoryl diester phosphodiesterase
LVFPGAESARIPELEDVLVLAEELDAVALVELKGEDPALARAALAAVERTRTHARVAFLSFSGAVLREAARIDPTIPRAPIFERALSAEALAAHNCDFAVFEARALTPQLAAALRKRSIATACYGVDDAATDARLDGMGVGLRISDRPDLLAARRVTSRA